MPEIGVDPQTALEKHERPAQSSLAQENWFHYGEFATRLIGPLNFDFIRHCDREIGSVARVPSIPQVSKKRP